MARQWDDLEQVIDGVRESAARSRGAAQSWLPLTLPGSFGQAIRQLRFRAMYRYMVVIRYTERLSSPSTPSRELVNILTLASRLVGPSIFSYLAAVSPSCGGFGLFFLHWQLDRQAAAQRLKSIVEVHGRI